MNLQRIAPEDVVGAYKRSDLKPVSGEFLDTYTARDADSGCAVGALAVSGYWGTPAGNLMEISLTIDRAIGSIRRSAFATGFNEAYEDNIGGTNYLKWLMDHDAAGHEGRPLGRVEILQWYEDGLAAGEAVRRWWKDKQDQNTRRVVYEEAVTAYQRTGIKPCVFSAVHENLTHEVLGCAMGVLAVDRGWVDLQESLEDSQPIWDSFVSYYGWSYTSGLTSGFDCGYTPWAKKHEEEVAEIMDTCESESERGFQGFKDGLEIGRRLYAEGIPSPVPDYPPLTLVKEEVMV